MAKPLRSPKDEADQPKHTIGWLQRIFRFLVEWKDETCNYTNKLDRIIMNQAELATGLKAIQTQVGKVEGVKTALQALDDVIPDAPPTP